MLQFISAGRFLTSHGAGPLTNPVSRLLETGSGGRNGVADEGPRNLEWSKTKDVTNSRPARLLKIQDPDWTSLLTFTSQIPN